MGDWRRHAIYFAPPDGSPLDRFGARWLGEDAATVGGRGFVLPAALAAGRPRITEWPRRYGFHATLKPPFALAAGTDVGSLDAAASALARAREPFVLPALQVAEIGRFIALVPTEAPPALAALAEACVTELDRFRAPPGADELARRRGAGLDAVEEAHLVRWGYPYVLDRFTFHLTLTGPLEVAERAEARAKLEMMLRRLIATPLPIAEICRFGEGPDGRFRCLRRFPLGGAGRGARGRRAAPPGW
jgi:putative phosphonate metabolism protein